MQCSVSRGRHGTGKAGDTNQEFTILTAKRNREMLQPILWDSCLKTHELNPVSYQIYSSGWKLFPEKGTMSWFSKGITVNPAYMCGGLSTFISAFTVPLDRSFSFVFQIYSNSSVPHTHPCLYLILMTCIFLQLPLCKKPLGGRVYPSSPSVSPSSSLLLPTHRHLPLTPS